MGWVANDPQKIKFVGKAVVFRIRKQQWWRIRDAGLGWRNQIQSIQIEHLPGNDHDAILRSPNVEFLATRVQDYLSMTNNEV